jgi:hypothetical protein
MFHCGFVPPYQELKTLFGCKNKVSYYETVFHISKLLGLVKRFYGQKYAERGKQEAPYRQFDHRKIDGPTLGKWLDEQNELNAVVLKEMGLIKK